MTYCIVETDDGWTIADFAPGSSAKEAAARVGGVLIDPGPYKSYEEAADALVALKRELETEDLSDIPPNQVIEGRYETDD